MYVKKIGLCEKYGGKNTYCTMGKESRVHPLICPDVCVCVCIACLQNKNEEETKNGNTALCLGLKQFVLWERFLCGLFGKNLFF